MTYKNINFDDSPIMRSLEKVAIKNGLAKPDEINKEAAKKIDLSPEEDLDQNIVKLCNGLRDSGFNKYADEIEKNFLKLKTANVALYNAIKETGEDVINSFHPDGSHSLSNMDGDNIVETIIDQKKKMMEVVNKTPKGKLANQDIINMVKIVLSEETDRTHLNASYHLMWEAANLAKIAVEDSGWSLFTERGRNKIVIDRIISFTSENANIAAKPNLTLENYTDFIENLNKMSESVSPNWFGGIKDSNFLAKINEKLTLAKKEAQIAKDMFSKKLLNETAPSTPTPKEESKPISSSNKFIESLDEILSDLQLFYASIEVAKLTQDEKATAKNWIKEQVQDVKNLKNGLNLTPPNKKDQFANINLKRLNELIEQNKQFKADWID